MTESEKIDSNETSTYEPEAVIPETEETTTEPEGTTADVSDPEGMEAEFAETHSTDDASPEPEVVDSGSLNTEVPNTAQSIPGQSEPSPSEPEGWYCFAASVVGASHQRKTPPQPNQDAYAIKPDRSLVSPSDSSPSEVNSCWVLTVADGHGSGKSFRSEIGSRLAVDTAAAYLWDCFCQPNLQLSYEAIYDLCQTQLPERLVRLWGEAVQEHLQANPFTEEELQRLPTAEEVIGAGTTPQSKRLDPQQLRQNYAYGTTLLGVVITDRFILYLQLGDGDIICVDSSGKSDRPFAKDPSLIANETTSLCLANAWQHCRVKLTPLSAPPSLIFVSTDGYANSFPTEEDFLETVTDYLRWLREQAHLEGADQSLNDRIEQELSESLADISQRGSGDDITVGLLVANVEVRT
ncbi:MAG: PP2C family serine/threonine-protein phosphatase [Prochlorotrichaceae cyanobacterium]